MNAFKKIILSVALLSFTIVSMALNPSREYKVKPEKYGMKYKEEKVSTTDGAILTAWVFELPRKTTNWIVISGSGDGNMSDELEVVNSFMSAGFNVMTYDYRGYGTSSDFTVDTDVYIYPQFINDLKGALDYLRKSRAITRFDLYGTNIGAGLSLGVGANRPETRKIIADGPWPGLEFMKKRMKEKRSKEVIIPFGFDKNYEPMYALDKMRTTMKGVMVIVSAQDEMFGPQDMKLIKAITDPFIIKSSTSNAENFSTDKNAYFERITKFLNN